MSNDLPSLGTYLRSIKLESNGQEYKLYLRNGGIAAQLITQRPTTDSSFKDKILFADAIAEETLKLEGLNPVFRASLKKGMEMPFEKRKELAREAGRLNPNTDMDAPKETASVSTTAAHNSEKNTKVYHDDCPACRREKAEAEKVAAQQADTPRTATKPSSSSGGNGVRPQVASALAMPVSSNADKMLNLANHGYKGLTNNHPVLKSALADLRKTYPASFIPANLGNVSDGNWCDTYLSLIFKDMYLATGNRAFTPPDGNMWMEYGNHVSKGQEKKADILIFRKEGYNHVALMERKESRNGRPGYKLAGSEVTGIDWLPASALTEIRRGDWEDSEPARGTLA